MADYNFTNLPNLSLDEVLANAAIQTQTSSLFALKNLTSGYSIEFHSGGSAFQYTNSIPSGGQVGNIVVKNAAGQDVYSLSGEQLSLAQFWSIYSAAGYTQAAAALAFQLAFPRTDTISGGDGDDHIGVYGSNHTVMGMSGNDTFLIHNGGTNLLVSGTNVSGDNTGPQIDTVELHGNAQFRALLNIEVLRFASNGIAKTFSASTADFHGITHIEGSTTGEANAVEVTTASEYINLDLSTVVFTNWGRANQTIRVDLNTNAERILDDRFFGSAYAERVSAGNGRDLLYGNAGDDYLDGGNGIDLLDGGEGNDTLIGGGGEGPNILKGGNGNDVYKFNEKLDVVIDTGGIDSWMVSKTTTLAAKSIFEGLAADDAVGAGKAISLTGNAKANALIGHDGRNTLNGLAGNDILEGRLGTDKLDGGVGNDKLYGGLGNDTLTGGLGKDTFYFDAALGGNVDRIVAFSTRDDSIALDNDIFTALVGSGKLASAAFYIGTKAKDAGDRIIYNKSTGALSYDADGTGTAFAAIKFATLDKNLKLTASDFLIV